MNLSPKTLDKLRDLINEETEYRSGPNLVRFFNNYGFSDTYYQGFPSRSKYTEDRLQCINGTSKMDKCIRDLFAPNNFINRYTDLDKCISSFNQYLSFDGWEVIRTGREISFKRSSGIDIDNEISKEMSLSENVFINQEFQDIDLYTLPIDGCLVPYIESRITEIRKCIAANIPLASIFLIGSTLEGVLLGLASKFPALYNCANATPKDNTGKVRRFHEWTLSNFIDVSYEVGFLKEDVKEFSHSLRDFRNYIHPFFQMSKGFHPDEHTAKICFQVLKAALCQIEVKTKSLIN